MKKIMSLLLVACTCLCLCLSLTACGHEHTYKTEWTYDDMHHWHSCEGEDCYETADKAEHSYVRTDATEQNHTMTCTCGKVITAPHSWGEWVVTVEPTKESAGTRVNTCSRCEYELSLPLQYEPETTITSFATAMQNTIGAENYEITFGDEYYIAGQHADSTYSYIGTSIYGDGYWTVEDSVKYHYYKSNGTVFKTSEDVAERYDARMNFLSNMLYFIDFTEDFEYSESWKAYEGSNIQIAIFSDVVGMESQGVKTYDKVRLYFEDDQLARIELELGNYSTNITIKYGTADFTIPTVD